MTTRVHDKGLSDATLKAVTPGRFAIDLSDRHQPGLIARVLPSGRIYFVVRYRHGGKQRRHALGEYGDALTLAKARKLARAALASVDAGRDIAADAQAARRATAGDTVADLAREYIDRHAKPKKRSWPNDQRMLDAEVLPKWKARKVKDIARRDVRDLVEAIADRGAPVTANRCLALIRKMLNFGIARDWVEANVASLIPKPGAETSRDRVLTDDELRTVWRCLERLPTTAQLPAPGRKRAKGKADAPLCPLSPAQSRIVKLRILTAQRGGEVAQMRRVDLETVDDLLAWWTIPGAHTKNKRPHRVPLVTTALAIVRTQMAEQDARRAARDGDAHVDETPEDAGFLFTDGETGAQDRAKKAPGILARTVCVAFRGHDLRRTAATKMREAGIDRSDIARILNHVEDGPRATAVYDRYNGDAEKRRALTVWDTVVSRLLARK